MVWRDGISNHGIIAVYTIRCPPYRSDLFGVTGNDLIMDACEGERYSRECGDQRGYCCWELCQSGSFKAAEVPSPEIM